MKLTRTAWKVGSLTTIFTLLGVMVAAAASGDLDTTFSGDGVQTTDFFGGKNEVIHGIALQADGKIVVVGERWDPSKPQFDASHNFALARYNANGSLDTTFSGDGKQMTDFGRRDIAYDVAIQPTDGKIVVAGDTCTSTWACDLAVARYKPNGSLDSTFSGDGKVVIGFGIGPNGGGGGLAIRGDGRIVIGGYRTNSAGDEDFAVYRLNPNGSLDTTFSADGKVNFGFGPGRRDAATDMALQSGKIVIVGSTNDADPYISNLAVARLNPDGSLDSTFSGDGRQIVGALGDDIAEAVALQPDGKIVVAGSTELDPGPTQKYMILARFTKNGSLDTTLDHTGTMAITSVDWDWAGANDVLVQSNGKILLVGSAYNYVNGTDDFALVRLWSGGSLDRSFSGDGLLKLDIGNSPNGVAAVVRQGNGRYVLAGYTDDGTDVDFALARVMP